MLLNEKPLFCMEVRITPTKNSFLVCKGARSYEDRSVAVNIPRSMIISSLSIPQKGTVISNAAYVKVQFGLIRIEPIILKTVQKL